MTRKRTLLVEVMPFERALRRDDLASHVVDFILAAYRCAQGTGPTRSCFVCDLAWDKFRLPVTLMLVQDITHPSDSKSLAGICPGCMSGDRAKFAAALKRDFDADFSTAQFIHDEARA